MKHDDNDHFFFFQQKLDKYKLDTSRNFQLHLLHIGMFLLRKQGGLHGGNCGNFCCSDMWRCADFGRHVYALAQVCESSTSTRGVQRQHPRGH